MRAVIALAALATAADLAAQQPRTIAIGQSMSAELTSQDPIARRRNAPYHLWTFQGRRGQKVAIDVLSGEFDSYLVLRDDAGNQIGADDDSGEEQNARLRTILPRDGGYRVLVTSYSENGRGRYTLALTGWESPEAPAPGAITALQLGTRAPGLLEPGDSISADGPYEDRWTLDLRTGQRVRVDMGSRDIDSYLIVVGPDGQRLGANDDGGDEANDASLSFRAASGGTYTVIASTYSDAPQSGGYRIGAIEETGNFPEPGETQALSSGQTREGRLETGDPRGQRGLEDRWTFSGREGEVARVDVISSQFDSYAYLRIEGMPVDSNDDGGEGNNARLMTVLPRTGTYTLVVTPYSASSEGGRYSVSLSVSQPPPGAGRVENIRIGQRVSGRLEPGDRPRSGGGYHDLWEFEGRANQDVVIEMQSGEFDSYLELRDQNGAVLSENDDGGEGQDALIITRLPANGRYRIVARSYGENERSGFYELSLTTSTPVTRAGAGGELVPGQVVTGRLERGDSLLGDSTYADVFTFRASESGELVVDMRSADFDAYLILRGPEGETLATDDDGGDGTNSRLSWRVERGRTYRIYANSYGEDRATGLYRLSVRFSSR